MAKLSRQHLIDLYFANAIVKQLETFDNRWTQCVARLKAFVRLSLVSKYAWLYPQEQLNRIFYG